MPWTVTSWSTGRDTTAGSMEDIKATGGCPKGNINALKDGIVTRGILFDATRLPGKAGPQGWLEPGTAIHREDLEALEKIERVKVSPGDVILLYTGRWKRRAALGPWPNTDGFAGYHADVAYFIKERGVSFIGSDGPNDVSPTGLPPSITIPLHKLALVAMGVSIFDNLDFERAAEEARRLNRYEFLFMAAPLRIEKGMGSPLKSRWRSSSRPSGRHRSVSTQDDGVPTEYRRTAGWRGHGSDASWPDAARRRAYLAFWAVRSAIWSAADASRIVVDLGGVTFIDSSGVGMMACEAEDRSAKRRAT